MRYYIHKKQNQNKKYINKKTKRESRWSYSAAGEYVDNDDDNSDDSVCNVRGCRVNDLCLSANNYTSL